VPVLPKYVLAGGLCCDTAEDNAVQQRVATQAVVAMHASGDLTSGVEARDGGTIRAKHCRVHVDLEAACERNVSVVEVTYSNSISVSEHRYLMYLGFLA